MKLPGWIYFICAFLAMISPHVVAEKLLVVTENFRPYNYIDNDRVEGVATDIVRKVLDRAGVDYQIAVYPWARAYRMAQTDKNILIYSLMRIPSREKMFKWIGALGKGGTTYLYRLQKNSHINPVTIEAAKQYQIVTNIDSMDHLWLKENGFNKLLVPPAIEQGLRMFYKGRGDMMAFDNISMYPESKNVGQDSTRLVEVMPLFKTPPYIAMSLVTSSKLIEKITQAYDALVLEGKIKMIN
jgi:polar amino acid transport system substrate-binding protein